MALVSIIMFSIMGYLGWVGGWEHMLCFDPVHLPPLKHTEINFTAGSKTPFLFTPGPAHYLQHVNKESSVDLFAKKVGLLNHRNNP